MAARSITFNGIVLKRHNTGETDRIVTLLTMELGKVAVVAKGIRKLHSSKASSLEPGNYVTAFCIQTASLPILTQAKLITDSSGARVSLKKMRQLHQFLEILDQLFVEEELELEFFADILYLREQILSNESDIITIRATFERILTTLGYHEHGMKLESILDKVSELTERPIRSFDFLVVKKPKDHYNTNK